METQKTRPNWLSKLSHRIRAMRDDSPSASIHCDESGLEVTAIQSDGSVKNASIKWGTVKSVHAFKRDVFAYDLLCMLFATAEGTVELNERMEGWTPMVDSLSSHLHGMPKTTDWWQEVVQPPFSTNMTKLYSAE